MTLDQHQSTADAPTAEWDDALLFDVAVDPFQQIATSGKKEGRAAGLRDGYLEGVNIGRSKGWEIGLELGYIHDIVQSILDGYQASTIRSSQSSSQEQKVGDAGDTLSAKLIPEQRRTSHRLERCLTLARDLMKMINEFPDPDTLLANDQVPNNISKGELEEDSDRNADNNACCSSNDNACTHGPANNAQGDINSIENKTHVVTKGTDEITLENEDASSASVPSANPAAMVDITTSIERIRAKFKLLCVLLKTKQSFDLKKILDSGTKMQQMTDNVGGLSIDQKDRDDVTPIKQEVRHQSDDKVGKSTGTHRKNVGPRNPNTEVDSDVFDSDW